MKKILDSINIPADLKRLSIEDLAKLAVEIRAEILDVVSRNGGHLSSNLGVVEITLALHRVFDTPRDLIVWDVGHQTYAHKIVTGRRDKFSTLRRQGGLLGFPSREESPYDPYNTGHASTALSAALGLAVARDMAGERRRVIAVVGDGSLTGGVSWEALNQIGHLRIPLIIVLNDNEMSISQSVGAISKYLGYLTSGQHYLRVKDKAKTLLKSLPGVGGPMIKAARALEEMVKKTFFPGLVFEELGLRYVGPVQGHSLPSLLEVFEKAKTETDGPVLIHCVTRKGRGYSPAQDSPEHFHGAPPFDVESGEPTTPGAKPSYSAVFGNTMLRIAGEDERVVAITAAMCEGTGLLEYAARRPGQFFDVGIAEQHAVNFAAGLAVGGRRPVCAIYSTFLQRAYDQIYHDVCLQNLPVVFVLDRAGLVPDDGPTHQGVNDIAYLRHMPNMVLMAPRDENEMRHMLKAAFGYDRPVAIRFPKSEVVGVAMDQTWRAVPLGKSETLKAGTDLVLAYGSMVLPALEAAERAEADSGGGFSLAVVDAKFCKPLDEELILRYARAGKAIATVEEGVLAGGFGSAVLELLNRHGLLNVRIKCFGLPIDIFPVGKRAQLRERYGLDTAGLAGQFRLFFGGPGDPAEPGTKS
ncbi:MAG: 1-deoxy-D-xylulose-5-phosphate synthase [Candidatus Aminicenantes bacterium]|nr:1-deoxy-D-xylulose-5-phosphate synthase [Candidatus Aminicenantes bacterium]